MLSLSSHAPMKALQGHNNAHLAAMKTSTLACGRSQLLMRGVVPQIHPCSNGRVLRVVVHGSKDDLESQLDLTQQTLDKVLAAVQAAQEKQQQQQQPVGSYTGAESSLAAREQQLWDRQLALMDRMQQQWDQERQAWLDRERLLLEELTATRLELRRAVAQQQAPGPTAAAAAAAASEASVAAEAPGLASYSDSNTFMAASSADTPAAAMISGPSPASAAVADAIRALRDRHVNPPAASVTGPSPGPDEAAGEGGTTALSSWHDLFPGAARASADSSTADSVAAAMAAVEESDVMADLDVSYSRGSSSRGRRRVSAADFSSSSSSGAPAAAAESSSNEDSYSSTQEQQPANLSVAPGEAVAAAAAAAVEVQKGDPSGPPPVLSMGDDDIFWVSKLHDGLLASGFYPNDDEIENWLFAEGTQSALLTFQACNDVPETGTTCEATWRKLIGEEEYEAAYGHLVAGSSSGGGGSSNDNGSSALQQATTVGEEQEVITFSFPSPTFTGGDSGSNGESSSSSSSSNSSISGRVSKSGWPVLMDMDGGKEVHALQVCLGKAGFSCGDDEMRWWQFGSATVDALKTFQACNNLPESGVCDERTWLALLGADATPEDLEAVRGDESMYEDDMAAPHEGAVWLLGEQRWSRPGN